MFHFNPMQCFDRNILDLSDMTLNLKNENLYDNYLVRPKKGIYCECPIFSVYSLLKNIVFYF